MNDLRSLFGPTLQSESPTPSGHPGPDPKTSLRVLVGEPVVTTAVRATGPVTDLRSLVGPSDSVGSSMTPSPIPSGPVEQTPPTRRSAAVDLAALVGTLEQPSKSATGAGLEALLGAQGERSDAPGWTAPELAQPGRRPLFGGRRRAGAVNYVSIAAAVLAVAALIGSASFAVVQRATANPADDAMVSLREREAELANEINVLQTTADLYAASASEGLALAEASAPVLAGLRGNVDAAPLDTAEASRTALQQSAAAALAAPAAVPVYERGQIDEKSLTSVGRALDDVRLAREALPELVADARQQRTQVVAAIQEFQMALAAVGAAIEAEAVKIVQTADAADSSYRSAVTDAAARVKATQQAGGDGLADMQSYVVAVDALRTENTRVLALRAEEDARTPSQPSTRNPSAGGSSPGSSPTVPGGSESTPSPSPSPSESNPLPSDPPSTEPTDPPVDPSEPPVDETIPDETP